jgi:hypothetical protein
MSTPGHILSTEMDLFLREQNMTNAQVQPILATLNIPFNNYYATTAPTVTDDSSDGYSVGSKWYNSVTKETYVCSNAAVGAAVWVDATLTEDELGSAAFADTAAFAPALGADDNYVTDAEKTVIGNTSGTNTGDQDLSGYALKSEVFDGYDYEIHVSQVDGDDTTGNGDLLTPVASITKALTLVGGARKTIIVHPGTYTENPSITVQYTTITGPGLIGGNIVIDGTLSTSTGCTIAGLKMTNLTVTASADTGNVNILNCEISGTFTKNNNATYTTMRLCDMAAANITGSGLVSFFGGNPNLLTVNNAAANVIVKGAVSVSPILTAGSLNIVDSVVVASGTYAISSAASSFITLANSQILVSALNNVAPVSLLGFYSIFNCVYDKPGSILAAASGTGGSTNSIDYFQYINADKFTTQGGTSSQFVKGDGSLGDATDFATAAQGDLADSALQPVAVTYLGEYNGGASYGIGDVVLYDGLLYERIGNPLNPGYPPPGTEWELFEPLIGSPAYDLWIQTSLAGSGNALPLAGGMMDENATILFDNGSAIREAGEQGLEIECSVGYRWQWVAGRMILRQINSGQIARIIAIDGINPSATDDITESFVPGTRWETVDGTVYVCADSTEGEAVWNRESRLSPSVSAWHYRAETAITSGNPTSYKLLWDNADQISATSINVSHKDHAGDDIEFLLGFIEEGQQLFIQDRDSSQNFQIWSVSGTPVLTDGGTTSAYFTFPVTLVDSGGTGTTGFPDNRLLLFGATVAAQDISEIIRNEGGGVVVIGTTNPTADGANTGADSFISGNTNHSNSGDYCQISGHNNHSNSGDYCQISGGYNHSNSGKGCQISGGYYLSAFQADLGNHTNSGNYCQISGGYNHSNSGNHCQISGSSNYGNTGNDCQISGSGNYSNSGNYCQISGSGNQGNFGKHSIIGGEGYNVDSTIKTKVVTSDSTALAASDTIEYVAHGLANGDPIWFTTLTGGAGLDTTILYYVVQAAADTFKVALAKGGDAVDITTNYSVANFSARGINAGNHCLISGYNNLANSGDYCSISGISNHSNIGYGCQISGYFNHTNSGNYCQISGDSNYANSGSYSSISGYFNHTNSGDYCQISGGYNHSNSGKGCQISGGYFDTASSIDYGNHTNSGNYCQISGAENHSNSGNHCQISGSANHTNSGYGCQISGNTNHSNTGNHCSISGSGNSSNSGTHCQISGAGNHTNSGTHSQISGAGNHTNSGTHCSISGAGSHTNTGNHCSISGSGNYGNTGTSCQISGAGNRSNTGTHCSISGSGNYGNTGNYCSISGQNNHTNVGTNCQIGGGYNHGNSGTYCQISGDSNYSNTGTHCQIGGGYNYSNSGTHCQISGSNANSNALSYARVHGGTEFARIVDLVAKAATTNATPTTLTLGGAEEDTTNRIKIPANSTWSFTATVVARETATANAKTWTRRGLIGNNGGAVTISALDTIGTDHVLGTLAASIAITADNTNDALKIVGTGVVAKNIKWTAQVNITQVG